MRHYSDCAVHNEPALPRGACDCGADAKNIEIANRFAAFFGGRPVGSLTGYEDKPALLAKEQERDREILAYVAETCI